MSKTKIAITLAEETVEYLDDLVKAKVYKNRSQAIQDAVDDRVERLKGSRLLGELDKVDADEEQALANEGLDEGETEWPGY
jgi:metal-responsive CopG/Arc/MetJ family transcriptional regulator